MLITIRGHSPELQGVPGGVVTAQLELRDVAATSSGVSVRVLGVDHDSDWQPIDVGPLPGQGPLGVDIVIPVPRSYLDGRHPIALELRAGADAPVLVDLFIVVASVDGVAMTAAPEIARGFRCARVQLEIVNGEPTPVVLALTGRGGDGEVEVDFEDERLALGIGECRETTVTFRSPLRWSGDPIQHMMTLTATRSSSSRSVHARFVHRSVFPWRARAATTALVVVALFVGAALVVTNWNSIQARDELTAALSGVGQGAGDRDADSTETADDSSGPENVPAIDLGTDDANAGTTSDGSAPDASVPNSNTPDANAPGANVPDANVPDSSSEGDQSSGPDTGSDGGADQPSGDSAAESEEPRQQSTRLRGTVTLADGSDGEGVDVSVTPVVPPDEERVVARSVVLNPATQPGKFWSARYSAAQQSGVSLTRSTSTIKPKEVAAKNGGVWSVSPVELRQNYEVVFSKNGYVPQRFFVSPPESGESVELDVELAPATGQIKGVVVDVNGQPIGGVSIEATDETSRVATKSNSEADDGGAEGEFQLDALNVPSVYTVIAQLDGYGTEIAQCELVVGGGLRCSGDDEPVAGDEETFEITMQSGVASISGRVRSNGSGTGGVEIVATIGDDEYRTTSLTIGDVGRFNLPRLPIPDVSTDTYTVSASGAGFISQSLAVDIAGSPDNVIFDMRGDTGGLQRRVVSDVYGPVSGALVTIRSSTDAFSGAPEALGGVQDGSSFIVRTASAPQLGIFVVDELPPGVYVVTVEEYRHRTSSTSVTVRAGQRGPLRDIILEAKPSSGDVTTDVTIRAVERGAEPVALPAILTLSSNNPDFAPRTQPAADTRDPPAIAQLFTGVPVGTYSITARADGYDTTTVTRPIGVDGGLVDVPMRKQGAVTIEIFDRAAGDEPVPVPLCGPDGSDCISVSLRSGEEIIRVGQISEDGFTAFSIADDVGLSLGVWTVTIGQHPPGFFVPNAPIPGGGDDVEVMQLRITRDSPSQFAVQLNAQAYPSVQATIYEPTGNGLGVARLQSATVAIVCTNGAGQVFVSATEVDSTRPLGEYLVGRREIQDLVEVSSVDLETCRLVAASSADAGAFAYDKVFAPTLRLGDIERYRDVQVRAVVLPPTPSVTGRVYWVTNSPPGSTTELRQYLPGTPIGSTDVIVDYLEQQTDDGTTPEEPRALLAQRVQAVWSGDASTPDNERQFTLNEQVFGTSTYSVVAPNIAVGTFDVTIPPSPAQVTGTSGVAMSQDALGYAIELTDPEPGRLGGCIRLESLNPDAFAVGAVVNAIPPGSDQRFGGPITPAPDGTVPCDDTTFFIDDAAAGNWEFNFLPPSTNYDLAAEARVPSQPPNPQLTTLAPNGTVTDLVATFIELGTLNLTAIADPGATGGPTTLPDTATATLSGGLLPAPIEASFTELTDRIPVSLTATNPTTEFEQYSLGLDAPGYDTTQATIVVTGDSQGILQPGTDAESIPVQFAAGSEVDVEVTLAQFGNITGQVVSVPWAEIPSTPVDERTVPPPINDLEDLRARGRRVDPDTGLPIDPAAWIPAVFSDITPGEFSLSGPAGVYEIEVTHEQYDRGAVPAVGTTFVMANGTVTEAGLFEIVPKRGTLSLTVLPQEGGEGIDGATVRLFLAGPDGFTSESPIVLQGAPATDFVNGDLRYSAMFRPPFATGDPRSPDTLAEAFTQSNGQLELAELIPATYWVQIRKDGSYPVTARITIPQDALAANRQLTLTAFMPPTASTINVEIRVANEVGDITSFPSSDFVPPPAIIQVTRTYDGPDLESPGGAIDNIESVAEHLPARPVGETGTALSSRVVFSNVAAGEHTLEVDVPADYTLRSPPELLTPDTRASDPDPTDVVLYYEVPNGDIVINPVDAAGASLIDAPGLTATLSYDGTQLRGPAGPTGSVIRFSDLPPKSLPYTVTVVSNLHNETAPREVVPRPPGDPGIDIELTASAARITGLVQLSDSAGSAPRPLPGTGVIRVFDPGGMDITDTVELISRGRSYEVTIPAAFVTGDSEFEVRASANAFGEVSAYTTVRHFITVTSGAVSANEDILLLAKPSVVIALVEPPSTATVELVGGAGSGIVGTERPDGTWTFVVLPGISYQFVAHGDDNDAFYYPITTVNEQFEYGIEHAARPRAPDTSFELQSRSVRVRATTADAGPASVSVSLAIDGRTGDPFEAGPAPSPLDTTFEMPDDQLPISGTARATISAPGYRTRVGTAPDTNRTGDIVVELAPLVALSGTLANDPGGTQVVATSPTATLNTQTNTDGFFDFGAENKLLDVGAWTVTAQQLGVGAITARTFEVTADDVVNPSAGVTPSASTVTVNAALLPRSIGLVPTVTRPNGGAALSGWTLNPATLDESDGPPFSVMVSHPGSLSETLDFALAASDVSNGVISVVRSVELYQAPTISGAVAPGPGGAQVANAQLLRGGCTGTPTLVNQTGVSGTSFSFPATASVVTDGAHCLRVTYVTDGVTTSGSVNLAVTKNASGPATVTGTAVASSAITVTLN